MTVLDATRSWPVPTVAAALVDHDGGVIETVGAIDHRFRLASLTKVFSAWAMLVAVEEGIVTLDQPVGQPGCTLEHLLAHAGGYPFDGDQPITTPASRRIYSNSGIEMATGAVETAAELGFADYLTEAVIKPLGLTGSELRGSPAHGLWSTVADVVTFLGELQHPRLISVDTALDAIRPHYPDLAGIVPGMGRFDPCPWGLGVEIRGDKTPHWTGRKNSPDTYGHFGGAGTMMWVDPHAAGALVALTDRPFDEWADDARRRWSELSDAAVEELAR